ncbi:MAG TPA: hypothetical protein VF526_14810 [Solirubrobacteraceae bacterium]
MPNVQHHRSVLQRVLMVWAAGDDYDFEFEGVWSPADVVARPVHRAQREVDLPALAPAGAGSARGGASRAR